MTTKFTYQSGDVYGRLILTGKSYISSDGKYRRFVEYVCKCGNIGWTNIDTLRRKNFTKSCGCLMKEVVSEFFSIHKLTKHPLYKVWADMKQRCYNGNEKSYKYYGGNGVTVCDEWKEDFKAFYDWCILKGWNKSLQLDKDILAPNKTGKIYSPIYCSLVTRKENIRNRKITVLIEHNSQIKSLAEWCEIYGINYETVRVRLKNKWSVEKSLETPARKRKVS